MAEQQQDRAKTGLGAGTSTELEEVSDFHAEGNSEWRQVGGVEALSPLDAR